MSDRQIFSSKVATILTMIGVSVGLGNVWRFPYMMGKFGGSAFLFIYLIFTLLFAIPAVMVEWALGRETRKGPIGAFVTVFGPSVGKVVGYMLIVTVLIANSYYLVVIGNVVYTGFYSLSSGFRASTIDSFQAGLNNRWLQYGIALFVLVASLFVIYQGLNKGIEYVSKLFVPIFSLVMIHLVISAFSLDDAPEKFAAFLTPDFGALTSEHVFAALGQAFFSLGLGGTFMLTYGSYLQNDEDLVSSAFVTGFSDAGAALTAALFIVPSILVFNLDMTQGPTLIFSTLPQLFSVMPAGRVLGTAFLVALIMVAFLSGVAALEVIVRGLTDHNVRAKHRNSIILFIGIIEMLLMLPSSLKPEIIVTLDLVFGSGMQVFGSALAVVGLTWCLGRSTTVSQIFSGKLQAWQGPCFFWIRWVVPGTLFVILFSYIYISIFRN